MNSINKLFSFLLLILILAIVENGDCVIERKTNMKKIMSDYQTAIITEWKKVREVCSMQSKFNTSAFMGDNPTALVDYMKRNSEPAVCFLQCVLFESGRIDSEMDLNPSKLLKSLPNQFKTGDMKEKYDMLVEQCDLKPPKEPATTGKQCNLGKTTVNCISKLATTIEKMPIGNFTNLLSANSACYEKLPQQFYDMLKKMQMSG